MPVNFTAQFVRDLPLSVVGQHTLFDKNLPGFGLRVGKRRKTYFVDGRVNGKTRQVTIGRAAAKGERGGLTLQEARALAKKRIAEMIDGKDRNAELRIERAKLMTLSQAVDGWLDERSHRASTAMHYRNTMQREFGDWHDMELRRITPKVFQKRYLEILARTESGAALAVRTFKSCWNWARADVIDKEGNTLLPDCPADIVQRKKIMPKSKRKQTYVSDWSAYYTALENVQTKSNRHKNAGEDFKIFMDLLARTGLRQNELANLRWRDIDLKRRIFTITADRAKNGNEMTLPLSVQSVGLLECLRVRTGGQTFIWGSTPLGDPRKTLKSFRMALGWPIGFHDLRRSFATIATVLDIQQSKLKRLLNHAAGSDVTAGYQVLSDPEILRSSVQQISDFIDEKRNLRSAS